MKALLKILNKLDVASNTLGIMLGIYANVNISPCSDYSFFVSLVNDDDNEPIVTIVIHAEDENNLSYHICQTNEEGLYDYKKIGESLACALGVYEEYKI